MRKCLDFKRNTKFSFFVILYIQINDRNFVLCNINLAKFICRQSSNSLSLSYKVFPGQQRQKQTPHRLSQTSILNTGRRVYVILPQWLYNILYASHEFSPTREILCSFLSSRDFVWIPHIFKMYRLWVSNILLAFQFV